MYKIIRTAPGHLLPCLKNGPRNLKFFTPTWHLHSPTKTQFPNSELGFVPSQFRELQSSKTLERGSKSNARSERSQDESSSALPVLEKPKIGISHPWPEWVELMELLLKSGYFKWENNPFQNEQLGAKESNLIRTACLNFARDRFDLIRFFSRAEIAVVAGAGCSSLDRKVVNSGKRLRVHVGIDEGSVCSSCILRGNCDRAYVKAHGKGGRTLDVMRILLTHGLDCITGSVENKPCQSKLITESVRRLLKEMVELSTNEPATSSTATLSGGPNEVPMKQGDWHCPKCNFLNFARNVRCLSCDGLFKERVRKLGEDQDHLPLKKGDWICDVCNFLNFAKNTSCLQCREKPKRQLNPGEWECDSCNYVNFRKNMVCLKCDHRRPKAANVSDPSAQRHLDVVSFHGQRVVYAFGSETGSQHVHRIKGQSQNSRGNVWKFAVDDGYHESIGFFDFPIVGGKSELSQSAEKSERWKVEMAEKSRCSSEISLNSDKFGSANLQRSQRKLELLESSDDEEMAEWFGHGKKSESERMLAQDS